MNRTGISWTDLTWNVLHGCTKVGEECDGCWSERQTYKMEHQLGGSLPVVGAGVTKLGMDGRPRWTNDVVFTPFNPHTGKNYMDEPRKYRKPSMVFAISVSDIFHPKVELETIQAIFDVFRMAPQHQFQILTKRPERMLKLDPYLDYPINVWAGTSIGMDKHVHWLDYIRQIGAAVKIVSLEPLLEDLPSIDLTGIHWGIIGGESGPGYRPMEIAWVENLKRKFEDSGTAWFFKQDASFKSGEKKRFLARPDLFGQAFPAPINESLRRFYRETEGRAKVMREAA